MNALVINCCPVRDGATAFFAQIIARRLRQRYIVRSVCIDDYRFGFCRGCRTCHSSARCIQQDGTDLLMDDFVLSDVIVCVSPSYWADIPGQFKAFIDRCTPWSNTHEPHKTLPPGKKGYAIALRTGPGMAECEKVLASITHFYGHLDIEYKGGLGLCSVENREAAEARTSEIEAFCDRIIS